MPQPAHMEIHVIDGPRARAFYEGMFGWTFSPMPGGEAVDYHLIHGDGIGPDGPLTGGMLRRMGAAPEPGSPIRGATFTFAVADVDATYARSLATGGAEALPPMDYPGFGRVAYCDDGEGNVFGMMTPEGGI